MFPVAVCVALRKLIVSNRDAGRPLDTKFGSHSLRGLRLERNSRLEIYHGFGYLWHFCETAKNQIQPQINWFIVGASYLFDPITFHVLTYGSGQTRYPLPMPGHAANLGVLENALGSVLVAKAVSESSP